MSIYASGEDIGMTDRGDLDGTVRQYPGSSRWPGHHEARGWIGIASIPGYCVPGAPEEAEEATTVGEYLRLDIADRGDPISATVVLTEAAVLKLYHQLGEWLMIPKQKEAVVSILIGPDCRDGKHTACDGRAWNNETDQPADCGCTCHGGTT